MGRGDSRTKRGKIFKASYGNARKHRAQGAKVITKSPSSQAPKKAPVTKKSK